MTTPDREAAMTTRYQRASDVLWRDVHSSVVLLPLRHGELVNLSGSGTALWSLLDEPLTVDELVDALSYAYSVEPELLRSDVLLALQALEQAAAVRRLEAS